MPKFIKGFQKGHKICLGRKQTKEHIKNRMNSLRLYLKLHPEVRRGKNNSNYGNHLSEESKKKIGEAHKGKKTIGFKGHKHKDESKLKTSETLKTKYESGEFDHIRKILSKSTKKLWEDPNYRKKVIENSLKKLLQRPTSYEQKILFLCNKFNLPFVYVGDGRKLIGYKNPDFINEEKRLVIEVFLDYFKIRDFGSIENYMKYRGEYFNKYGYKTIFISEREIESKDWEDVCLNKIKTRL